MPFKTDDENYKYMTAQQKMDYHMAALARSRHFQQVQVTKAFVNGGARPAREYKADEIPSGAFCLYCPSRSADSVPGHVLNHERTKVCYSNTLSMRHIDAIVRGPRATGDAKGAENKTAAVDGKKDAISTLFIQSELAKDTFNTTSIGEVEAIEGGIEITIPCKFQNNSHRKTLKFNSKEHFKLNIQAQGNLDVHIGIDREIQAVLVRVVNAHDKAIIGERLICFNRACKIINHIDASPATDKMALESDDMFGDVTTTDNKKMKLLNIPAIGAEEVRIFNHLDAEYPNALYASIEKGDPTMIGYADNDVVIDEYGSLASKFTANVFLLEYVYACLVSLAAAAIKAKITSETKWDAYVKNLNQWINKRITAPGDAYQNLKHRVAFAAAIATHLSELVDFKRALGELYADGLTTGHRLIQYFASRVPMYRITAPNQTHKRTNHVVIEPVFDDGFAHTWNSTYAEKSIKAKVRFFWRLFITDFSDLFENTGYVAGDQISDYAKNLINGAISVTVDATHQLNFRVQLPYQTILGNTASENQKATMGTLRLTSAPAVASESADANDGAQPEI